MSPTRFLKKCLTDRKAAAKSARLVARLAYARLYWMLRPRSPLPYHLPDGGVLLLEPKHAFTNVFWPDVERYEPDVSTFLRYVLKPGGTFIDCGANVGFFSIQAGALVGSGGAVISIEANPKTYKLLERNLKANHFGLPVHCALTTQTGEVELFVPGDWDVFSSLRSASVVDGVVDNSFKVRGRTLDDVIGELALTRVDLVKLDIEGAEFDALRSAPGLLREFRPQIITEYGVGTWPAFSATAQQLQALAKETDYTINLFCPEQMKLALVTDEVWQREYVNLVLSPKECQI
jgi:FkbM family methyltransferase